MRLHLAALALLALIGAAHAGDYEMPGNRVHAREWLSGDCTLGAGGHSITCTKTNSVAFGPIATLGIGAGLNSVGGNLNIATTITAGGPVGSATVTPIITYNALGQLDLVSSATITPAFSSLTGVPTTLAGYGITSPLNVAQGGTNLATLTAHAVLLGEGTSSLAFATIGTGGRMLLDQGAGADPSFNAMSQDCTITSGGVITCTKTNNVAFAASATTDTTNASNISSGTLGSARLPNPTASTLGGIESYAAVSHQWIHTISTSGVPSSSQPAVGDLASVAANTVVANVTNSTGAPTAYAMSSCPASDHAVTWVSGSGFGCNASIQAATLGSLASAYVAAVTAQATNFHAAGI